MNTAVAQLLEVEEKLGEGYATPDTQAVGMARLGQPDQLVRASICPVIFYDDLFLTCPYNFVIYFPDCIGYTSGITHC